MTPHEPPTDLALAEDVRLPDIYEQRYMGGDGVAAHRYRHHAPFRLHAAFAVAAGLVAVSAIAAGQWLGLMIGLSIVALVWLLSSVLRVTVSTRHVNVHYGLFGRKIPVAAIESSEVITYDWLRGWSVRRSHAGERTDREAVRVAWRDRRGRRCVTLIGSRHAASLATQIEHARRALPTGTSPPALRGDDKDDSDDSDAADGDRRAPGP